jgi:hypothetical protein
VSAEVLTTNAVDGFEEVKKLSLDELHLGLSQVLSAKIIIAGFDGRGKKKRPPERGLRGPRLSLFACSHP